MVRPTAAPPLHELLRHSADAVRRVRDGSSLTDALQAVPQALRPGCQAVSFHVMRWRSAAEAARAALVPKPPAPELDALLICALALLWPPAGAPYAAHTVVDEAVTCARRRAPRSAGFVNAVLRNFLRQADTLVTDLQRREPVRWAHPAWWIERLRRDWPTQAEGIMAAAQRHPPMTLRAQGRAGAGPEAAEALSSGGLGGHATRLPRAAWADPTRAPDVPQPLPQAWTLDRPVPVSAIPGFAEGRWSVQDAAAQLAAPLLLEGLAPAEGQRLRLLDACAAPGGKTAHLLDLADADLTALDADPDRLPRVADTLRRLGLSARLQAADARRVDSWWNGHPFDGILLDAPCSASGIVRRHPDVRWLRRPSDIEALVQTQASLLDALWPLVRPGGRLLYATCSVFRAEGEAQIAAFLQRQGLAPTVLDPRSPGHLLPLTDNPDAEGSPDSPACDGFFYALLHKP